MTACNSNTALTRSFKGMTTRYNLYFNGYEAYKEGLKAMEEKHDEEFSQRIWLHPVYQQVGKKEPSPNSHFDRAIEKSKMALQRRSITNKPKHKGKNTPENKLWMQRGEYNPYMHNVWMLSGKAQFMKGDFNAAATTFGYIIRHFWWKPYTIAECHIWLARIYAVQGYGIDAETELGLVIPAKQYQSQQQLSKLQAYRDMTRSMRQAFSLAQAEILLSRKETAAQAVEYLQVGRGAFQSQAQKLRCDYLIAQLLEERGDYQKAYDLYGKLGHSGKDYKTQFNAKIAQVNVMAKRAGFSDSTNVKARDTRALRQMERKLNGMRLQYRNEEYLDQIHYGLGNVALMRGDTAKAITQLETALEKSKRNGLDKAVAALRLGEVAFMREDYVKAQKAYSTAMGIINKEYPNYAQISRLSNVLDELQTHAETVQLQDSLLDLSKLPEEELNKVIDRIIKELIEAEKKAELEARMAEYEGKKSTDPLAQQDAQQPIVGQQDKSWYFYNPAQVSAGKTEFQRKWGSRKPEDNWRRKNKTETLSFDDESELTDNASAEGADESLANDGTQPADSTATAEVDQEALDAASDPHKREYYLAQIPFTDDQKANANQLIEEGMYNMGVIINEKLENFPLAIRTFVQLEQRYPESEHRVDMYYAIYLMYMRMSDMAARTNDSGKQHKYLAEADLWRRKLMNSYPESAYGVAVSDPNYIETLRYMVAHEDSLYIQTYEAYLAGETQTVHDNYTYVHEKWPLSKLMPKFQFLHALSYVQDGESEQFKDNLESLTATYPQSDVSPLASLMLKGYREGRQLQLGTTTRSMVWGTSLRDQSEGAMADSAMQFLDDDNVPHLLLLAFKTDSLMYQVDTLNATVSKNNLLFEIAKFNFENYLVKDFDLEIIDTGSGLSVLVISGFSNLHELIGYHDRIDNSDTFWLPETITQIDISDPNFRLLLQGRTFEEYFQWIRDTYGEGEVGDGESETSESPDETPDDDFDASNGSPETTGDDFETSNGSTETSGDDFETSNGSTETADGESDASETSSETSDGESDASDETL